MSEGLARRRLPLWYEWSNWGYNHLGWSGATRQSYVWRVRAADLWLTRNGSSVSGRSILSAGTKDLAAYLFGTPPTARTRNGIRCSLIGFYRFLIETGRRTDNPAVALPRIREPRPLPKALEVEEGTAIAEAAVWFGPMTEALVLLLLYAGLRRDEARTLEWSTWDGGWLYVTGKGAKERAIPVHGRLHTALVTWRAHCPDARWVFPSPRCPGRPVSGSWVARRCSAIGQAAAASKHLHPHLLRHTFATRLLDTGSDIRDVQEALGHASPSTTAIYTRIRPARLAEAVGRLDF